MPVDIQTEIEIDRPRGEVAEYVSDPDNATIWYENVREHQGDRMEIPEAARGGFPGRFRGSVPRSPPCLYLRVKEMSPGERFVNSGGAIPDGDDVLLPGRRQRRYQDDASKPRRTSWVLPARRSANEQRDATSQPQRRQAAQEHPRGTHRLLTGTRSPRKSCPAARRGSNKQRPREQRGRGCGFARGTSQPATSRRRRRPRRPHDPGYRGLRPTGSRSA